MLRDISRQKWAFSLTFLLLGILVMSCMVSEFFTESDSSRFPEDPRVDRSFVTGQPCAAPCWYGLRVGESTLDDIRKTLPELPFADADQIHEQPTGDFGPNEKSFTVPCIYSKKRESCAGLETSPDGILRGITVLIDYELPLRLVVQKLGNPEYYTVNPSLHEDACSLFIYWPDKSIVAIVNESPIEKCANSVSEPVNVDLQVVAMVYAITNTQDQQHDEPLLVPWIDAQQ